MTFRLSKLASLTALCLMAGAVNAQSPASSSVTLYGQIDLAVGHINNGTSSLFMPPPIENGKHNMTTVKGGGPTLLGFRGLEDLGNGLSAGFDIQHRLYADTGALENANIFWHGKSLLFLRSANLGEIFMGRDNILAFYNVVGTDPFAYDYSPAATGPDFGLARYSVAGEGGFRASNQVGYRSPRLGGFALNVAVAAGEGTGTGRKRNESLSANYISGPLYAGLGYDKGATLAGQTRKVTNLAAIYDFRVVKVSGSWARSTDEAGATPAARRNTAVTMGLWVPVGQNYVKAAISRLNPDGATNNTNKLSLGYEHVLSKRTSLKTSIARSKTEGLTATTGYEAGVVHRF